MSLVSLAVFASLFPSGCATTSKATAMAAVNVSGLDRDDVGLTCRDERTARTAAQTEHHVAMDAYRR